MRFTSTRAIDDEDRISAVTVLLGALRQNGQVLGTDFTAARQKSIDSWFLSVPEKGALSTMFNHNACLRRSVRP
jgi:hypothetical protein